MAWSLGWIKNENLTICQFSRHFSSFPLVWKKPCDILQNFYMRGVIQVSTIFIFFWKGRNTKYLVVIDALPSTHPFPFYVAFHSWNPIMIDYENIVNSPARESLQAPENCNTESILDITACPLNPFLCICRMLRSGECHIGQIYFIKQCKWCFSVHEEACVRHI